MSQKKKILLIGSSGNIGQSLCNELSKNNFLVHGISKKRNIKSNRFKNFQLDYRNDKILRKFLKNKTYDFIINLIIYNKQQALRDFLLLRKITKHYFFVSSTSVYKPTKDKLTNESIANDKRWSVAKKKLECEKLFLKKSKKEKFPVTIIRAGHVYNYFTVPSNIIGLGNNLISLLKNNKPAIIFKKNVKRSLIHSDDFARIFVRLLKKNEKISENILNITSLQTTSWEEIYKLYFKYLNKEPKFVYVKTKDIKKIDKKIYEALIGDRNKDIVFDHKKMRLFAPNFKEKFSLKRGIGKIVEFHNNSQFLKANKKIEKVYKKLILVGKNN